MKVSVFDKLAVCRPVNASAALAISGGLAYQPQKGWAEHVRHSDVPLPTRPYPQTADPLDDITGRRFGRLLVLGLSASLSGRWVVRCVCGSYEHRRRTALCQPHADMRFMCSRCDHTNRLRERGRS